MANKLSKKIMVELRKDSVKGRATLNRAGIETWFLAVYQGRFAPDDGLLEPKNQVSKDITIQCGATA